MHGANQLSQPETNRGRYSRDRGEIPSGSHRLEKIRRKISTSVACPVGVPGRAYPVYPDDGRHEQRHQQQRQRRPDRPPTWRATTGPYLAGRRAKYETEIRTPPSDSANLTLTARAAPIHRTGAQPRIASRSRLLDRALHPARCGRARGGGRVRLASGTEPWARCAQIRTMCV